MENTSEIENPPNTAEKTPLSTLLNREKAEEATLGYARKESLLHIAEYILGHHYYTKEEYREAIALLAKYHLWKLADKNHRGKSWMLIEAEYAKPYEQRCSRCGLPISSKKSLATGLGIVCRKKSGDI